MVGDQSTQASQGTSCPWRSQGVSPGAETAGPHGIQRTTTGGAQNRRSNWSLSAHAADTCKHFPSMDLAPHLTAAAALCCEVLWSVYIVYSGRLLPSPSTVDIWLRRLAGPPAPSSTFR